MNKLKFPAVRTAILTVVLSGVIAPSAMALSAEDVQKSLFGASAPDKPEYLPDTAKTDAPTQVAAAATPSGAGSLDFSTETPGAQPKSLTPAVGNWVIGQDKDNTVMVVDGRDWSRGQPAAGVADKARALYGERYAEFLDNVKAYAYFPYAVLDSVPDFKEGTISLRFKGIDGRVDQAAGILFNLQPNGDYLTVRANSLEDNLVLFQFVKGKRSSVEWVRNTPTPSGEWHDLKVEVKGKTVKGYLNGKHYLTHELDEPISGRIGLWSKADSVVYFDDLKIEP